MNLKQICTQWIAVATVSMALLTIHPNGGFADISLPAVISDNMVLQQNSKPAIWGWSEPGENISICASWTSNIWRTATDTNGKWILNIETPGAGGPYEMTITGSQVKRLKNILIGEVWLCSGQSNMEMPVGRVRRFGGVQNYMQEIAAANYPDIRLFFVERKSSPQPQSDCVGKWMLCGPETVANFSAVAYFFGRELHKKLKVPIGLIDTSWGGTPAEAWTSRKILQSDPAFAPTLKRYVDAVAKYPQAKKDYEQKLKQWEHADTKVLTESKNRLQKPVPPMGPGHYQAPAGLYNAMIAPLIGYRIKGVIWYQGESNRHRAYQYRKLFPAMIENWRDDWGQGDFPFYYVQISSWNYPEKDPVAAELREAQLMTLSVPNTGMVVTIDIGDVNNIHPKNKADVGKRLAILASAKTYGHKGLMYSGPIYKSVKVENNKIRLFFDHVGSGLVARGGVLTHFTIAGKDRNFVQAKADIYGETIVVHAEQVSKPVAVRFAWSNAPVPNLFNKEGLPASPFRTDDWPESTFNKR